MSARFSPQRRRLMLGLGASAAAGWLPRAAAQGAAADVAVIGAGAAGLSAAKQLAAAGLRVVVLEARERIGGRAWTDTSLGFAWDRGASWLHAADRNPWVGYARDNGFEPAPDRVQRHLHAGQRRLGGAETAGYRALRERIERELQAAGRRGLDIPAEAALTLATRQDPWYPTVVAELTAWEGASPGAFSALDHFHFDDSGGDWVVAKGYGALLAHYARDVDVRLRTPVRRLRWQARGVTVETAAGDLAVRAAVVAVPASVIAAGALDFRPGLPPEVLAAHHDLPPGLANKVALRFRRNPFPREATEQVRQRRDDGRGLGYLVRPNDSHACVGYAAGAVAQELEAAGEAAAIEHALGELVEIYGGELRRHFDRGAATAWGADPWSRGAYSYCLPGRFGARARLTQPVGGRLFFAGEHTEQAAYGTLHGAHLSGLRAARQVRESLATLRP